jgi:1,4-alpha-glucan branching enzyme
VLNFGARGFDSYTLGFPQSGVWRVRFNSDWSGYDASFGNAFSYDTTTGGGPIDSMPFRGNVGLGPYSAIILSQAGA